nr:nucleotidyl transferase AbiEii/AbiGii toxin family protein [Rhizobium leucaenae]
MKGGTAINLFLRDLPRLSVDIDLVYFPMDDRDTALKNITAALGRIADSIQKAMPETEIIRSFEDRADALRRFVTQGGDRIKIELSPLPSRIGISGRIAGVFAQRRREVRLRRDAVTLISGPLRRQDLCCP